MQRNTRKDTPNSSTPFSGSTCFPSPFVILFFRVIDDYSLVNFQPLDSSDEESINYALAIIDTMLQWGEDQDVKVRDEEERDFENEMNDLNLDD